MANDETKPSMSAADRAELLARLEAELADRELLKQVANTARLWVDRLRDDGIPMSTSSARDFAHDAVVLTIEGRRPWDGTYPLKAHLNMIVRSLASDMERRHGILRPVAIGPEVRWDETNDGECARAAELARRGPKPERASRKVSLQDAAGHILRAIRALLAGDAAVQLVADAWARGDTERAEGIAATGLDGAAYDAAVKRIQRLIRSLPEEVREGTRDAMEVSYGA